MAVAVRGGFGVTVTGGHSSSGMVVVTAVIAATTTRSAHGRC